MAGLHTSDILDGTCSVAQWQVLSENELVKEDEVETVSDSKNIWNVQSGVEIFNATQTPHQPHFLFDLARIS
jgi:hypothetical protein